MKPWAVRVIGVLVLVGIVASIALGSALPIVMAICLTGLLAASALHGRR
jgi:hypothetical protein